MSARVRVGTRLDPDTERPRILAWAAEHKRTEAEAIRLLALEALDAQQPATGAHPFEPQARNALKCATCGGKRGDHR